MKWLNQKSVSHFLELPLAVSGAQDLLFGEIDQHRARAPLRLHLLGRALAVGPVFRRSVWLRLLRDVSLRLLRGAPRLHRRPEIIISQLAGAQADRLEPRQPRGERGIRNTVGSQLLLDVGGETDLPDALDVAGPRAEARAVEHVKNGLVVGLGGDRGALSRRGRGQRHGGHGRRRDSGPDNDQMRNRPHAH